ncbi:YcdB/YcdC domain-containing protein [Aquibacillus albus]|uniref:Small secreted protein n=1 Tax=Aquibacillus albus TaxID=1168171 RepID=A0ABS2MX57_9BACI|nr:YcdB/YcdC domain-containing protein [Aquibacillus albus]MBM7570445.1 putative small secreted protein [Aquibacillus albus]
MKKKTVSLLGTMLVVPGLIGGYSGNVVQATSSIYGTNSEQAFSDEATDQGTSSQDVSVAEQQQLMEEAQISKEKAIEIAQDFVNLSDDYNQENVSFRTNHYINQSSVWTVSWRKQSERTYDYVRVTLDANSGDIVAMNRNTSDPELEASYPPKVDRSEAKEIALSLIEEQFPDLADQVEYDDVDQRTPLQGNVVYNLRFDRTINNVPFKQNFIMIRINGNGDLVGLDYRWNKDVIFPSKDGVISQANAESKLKETLPLRLQYRIIRGVQPYAEVNPDEQKDQYALEFAYTNLGFGAYFDAKKGAWVDSNGNQIESTAGDIEPISSQALGEAPSTSDKELSQEQALEVFKNQFEISDNMTLEHASYNEHAGNGRNAYWNFNWRDENTSTSTHGRIDAKTGEIIEYSNYSRHYNSSEEVEQVITYDEAKEKAIETVKELVPWKANQLGLDPARNREPQEPEQRREFTFNFNRLVNGIVVPNHNVYLTFSAEDGTLIRFHQNWDVDAQFPEANNVISIEEGKNIYFDAADIDLVYIVPQQEPPYHPADTRNDEDEEVEAKLAYTFRVNQTSEPVFLDAMEGKWVSAETGEPIVDTPEPTDINGHWAEQALRLMIEYQAIEVQDDGKVLPNEKVTRGEMVKMLMLSTNPNPYYYKEMSLRAAAGDASFADVSTDSAYFPYVESAVQQGIIDTSKEKFNPEETVSREELADMIVRALRYDKLAEIDEMFNLDFKDAAEIENPGTVSIVSHLGIMIGSNGYFRPDHEVTRAQAAQTYFEFLKKRGKYMK